MKATIVSTVSRLTQLASHSSSCANSLSSSNIFGRYSLVFSYTTNVTIVVGMTLNVFGITLSQR